MRGALPALLAISYQSNFLSIAGGDEQNEHGNSLKNCVLL
jgi:hypothetical protein